MPTRGAVSYTHLDVYKRQAMPRAPDGREPRAAGHRSIDASHCRPSPTGNPCAHAFSAAARIEHRDAALARLVAESRAATTRARTSLSGRSRWMLRNVGEERVSETVRAAKNRARVRGSPLRTRKEKSPRKRLPRAFAFLGDRGDRSPERRSVLVGDGVALQLRPIVRLPAGIRIAQEARRCEAAVFAKGGHHRNGSKQGVFDAVVRRWARTLHPSFSLCKHFFHIRSTRRRAVAMRRRVRRRREGRPKPPFRSAGDMTVSYTHLDVYKRQGPTGCSMFRFSGTSNT